MLEKNSICTKGVTNITKLQHYKNVQFLEKSRNLSIEFLQMDQISFNYI